MDTQDKEPQVAPAMHVGAQVSVGREDLREQAGICRPPLTGGDDLVPKSMHIASTDPPPAPVSALIIRPNPASTWVVFEYRLVEQVNDAYIRVVDINGREVKRMSVSAPEGQPVYDTRSVAKGAYTVELLNGGKTVEHGKLIVE